MNRKRLAGWGQNAALLLLTALALFLLTRLLLFHSSWPDGVPGALAPAAAPAETPGEEGPRFPSVHIMITGDSDYGRCGTLYAVGEDPLLQQILPLFREALGSAGQPAAAADQTLRGALNRPSLYLDLTVQLPLAAVELWLEEDAGLEGDVRSLALTAETEDSAVLYLRSGDGSIRRCSTALPASAVEALCQQTAPNGSRFAYEADCGELDPYTLLTARAPALPDVEAGLPAGYTAYSLLTALDFNAHTNSRYTVSGGVEVVEESPRTLRIGPDGTVSCSSSAETSSPLFQVPSAAGRPSAAEALQAAGRLAEALSSGVGASPVYLSAVEETAEGWLIRFRCQADGVPVLFPDGGDALSVSVSGTVITAFTYRCRAYTAAEDGAAAPLTPPAMAAAMAAYQHPEEELSIGYVDSGSGTISACWLAGYSRQ